MAERVKIPHIAWPLRLTDDGTLAVVEQDTIEDVRQCVRVLRRTPLGARPLAPLVGVPDPTFSAGVDPEDLEERLEDEDTGEPRAEVTVTATPIENGRQRIRIAVQLAADADSGDQDAEEML
jgi:hypothetical protein